MLLCPFFAELDLGTFGEMSGYIFLRPGGGEALVDLLRRTFWLNFLSRVFFGGGSENFSPSPQFGTDSQPAFLFPKGCLHYNAKIQSVA